MPTINLNEINWLAVIVAALAAFMVGGLWYGPLFSKPWIKAQGWSDEQVAALKAQMNPAKFFGGMLLAYFILGTVLAILAQKIIVETAIGGLFLGLMLWAGIAAVTLTHQIASSRANAAYFIDTSCEFVYMLIMGTIIGAWR